MTRKKKTPQISDIDWGKRTLQIVPPGVAGIAIAALIILIGVGIVGIAKDRSEVHNVADNFFKGWLNADYSRLHDLYEQPEKCGVRDPGCPFMPEPSLTDFEVPEITRRRLDNNNLPIVFTPADWQGRQSPWVLDLSRILSYELEQVTLWRKYGQGAASAKVVFASNQGPVERRVVILCLTASSRCPITFVQILPPGRRSVVGF